MGAQEVGSGASIRGIEERGGLGSAGEENEQEADEGEGGQWGKPPFFFVLDELKEVVNEWLVLHGAPPGQMRSL
jgi:hypothetical protein